MNVGLQISIGSSLIIFCWWVESVEMLRADSRVGGRSQSLAPTTHYVVLRAPRPPTSTPAHAVTIKEHFPQPEEEMEAHSFEDTVLLPQSVTTQDLWRYCRVCACAFEAMVPIYDDNGIEMQLEEKINNYLPITVTPDDPLPLQMCHGCVEKLNITHELIVSCLDSDARFHQFMEEGEQEIKCEVHSPQPANPADVPQKESYSSEEKAEDAPKVKKKVVVLKLVHSNSSQLPPSVRIAKALEYLKSKKKVEDSANATTNMPVATHAVSQPAVQTSEKFEDVNPELQVAGIAEFCVVTSGKDGSGEINSGSPKFESKITEALGTVDNGTKQRIVEAVHSIVSKHGESQGFTCSDCGQDFSAQGDLADHLCPRKPKLSKVNEFTCRECNKKFKDAYKLTIHKQLHKKGVVFICHECGKTFPRWDSLHIHQNVHKGIKPYRCKHCGQRFLHRGSLHAHLASEHALTRPWACKLCDKAFATKNNWRLHMRTHRMVNETGSPMKLIKVLRQEAFRCTQCPKAFPTQERLRQHEPIHRGVRPYQCGICAIGFIRKGNLTKHYKTHQAEKAIPCPVCKATFPSVAGLLNHRKSHATEEWDRAREGPVETAVNALSATPTPPDSFQCAVCSKFLSSKLSLALHTRVHTGEKPYACEVCGKRFTQKPALTYHLRLHTGERPHACRFCGKGFNSKVGKESHERIHTGERPYKCGQCGVGFRCSANLRQHTWIHTDNRPFMCEVCNKLFRRREALQVHMRIHTGERPYSCPVCSRSFTQKGDMLKHSRSHDKKTSRTSGMACLYCSQIFTRKMHHKIHMEQCSMAKGEFPLAAGELVTLKDGEALRTVTVASTEDSVVPKFSEITIVTNDIQEYEVEYQS